MDAEKNILDQLKKEGIKGKPFSVPTGYFSAFAQRSLATIKKSEASNEPESNLSIAGATRKMPFSVPDGYFQNLHFKKPSGLLLNKFNKAIAIAASFIILITSAIYLLNKPRHIAPLGVFQETSSKVNDLSNEQLENFIYQETKAPPRHLTRQVNKSAKPEQLLKDISDKELSNFLEETSDNNDDVLMN